MKKSKMTLGIMAGLLAATFAAGCDVTYSPDGYILTYKNSAGETQNYTANDLFGSYYNDSSKVSSMFDNIYKLIVGNYFKVEASGIAKYEEVLKKAKNEVEGIKNQAKKNADTNSTNYDEEWDSLLKSYSCEDEEELLQHFLYQKELEEFNKQFYDNNTDLLRDSVPTAENPDAYDGYLNVKVPYHVRHILVKISDSSSTNFWNSTIDASNAIKLYDVVSALAKGNDSFGRIAQLYSDDSSSSTFGDLGIMDKDTGFVNEFKLGVYAYENLYNNSTKAAASSSNIKMSDAVKNDYEDVAGSSIAKIPYGAFVKLNEVNNVTLDEKNREVNDGSATYYPRNVYFNKYLNKHAVGVITPTDVEGETSPKDYSTLPGFNFTDTGDGLGKILRTKEGQPILVVRAGDGSNYQGIHFIVVQRTPLIKTVNNVTVSEYYTTKYPGQTNYPVDASGSYKQTYVNFLNQETKDYKTRATEVENKIKNFDSNLNKYIYKKYVESEKIKFNDEKLENSIDKWIESTKVSAKEKDMISWEQTWNSYIETLKVQEAERSKLIPEVCAIGFKTHTGADWAKGGQCNDNKIRGEE